MSTDNEVARDIIVAMIANRPNHTGWAANPEQFTAWVTESYEQVLQKVKEKWEVVRLGHASSRGGR